MGAVTQPCRQKAAVTEGVTELSGGWGKAGRKAGTDLKVLEWFSALEEFRPYSGHRKVSRCVAWCTKRMIRAGRHFRG